MAWRSMPGSLPGILFLLLLSPSLAAFDPISLGADLACSACTLTANAIEAQLVQFGAVDQRQPQRSLTKQLMRGMRKYCNGLEQIATSGVVGEREFVDLGMALSQDKNSRLETKLSNVKMGPEVQKGVRNACHYFSSKLFAMGTVEKTLGLERARTMQQMGVRRVLCMQGDGRDLLTGASRALSHGVCQTVHKTDHSKGRGEGKGKGDGKGKGKGKGEGKGKDQGKGKAKSKSEGKTKGKVKVRRTARGKGKAKGKAKGNAKGKAKDKAKSKRRPAPKSRAQTQSDFLAGRPFLIGRAHAGDVEEEQGREAAYMLYVRCEACALLVEDVGTLLGQQVAKQQRMLEGGMRVDQEFDVRDTVREACKQYHKGVAGDSERAMAALRAPLKSMCREVRGSDQILDAFANGFSGAPPHPSNMYMRRGKICAAVSAACAPPPEGLAPKVSQCEACRLVVRDAVGQLRRRGSGHALARSSASLLKSVSARKAKKMQTEQRSKRKALVSEVLESLCSATEARHPRRIASLVSEECEELLEDWESKLNDILLKRLEILGHDHGQVVESVSQAAHALREVAKLEDAICVRTAKRCSASTTSKHDEL